jgi:hypothetical protein
MQDAVLPPPPPPRERGGALRRGPETASRRYRWRRHAGLRDIAADADDLGRAAARPIVPRENLCQRAVALAGIDRLEPSMETAAPSTRPIRMTNHWRRPTATRRSSRRRSRLA